MSLSVQGALRRIDKVLDSSFDPANAYPLRARLGRAILASSDIAVATGASAPSELSSLMSRLQSATKHVMQPSEPFDSHWREQWADILEDLKRLRSHLVALASSGE